MSKYVKNLIADHLRHRLEDVHDALLVNVIGLGANANNRLRTELHRKGIQLVVVKNSLAARAAAGTPLEAMFRSVAGTCAICWGGEDIVSLTKEVTRLAEDALFPAFEPRGGVMDGQQLSAQEVAQVSKWPSRTEQLSLLLGQILSPGANLVSQLTSGGAALASQIEQRGEQEGQQAEASAQDAAPPSAGT